MDNNDQLSEALFKRTLNNIYELLERIHIKTNHSASLTAKDQEGIKKFYEVLVLINKRSKNKKVIPFIIHNIGNT